MIDLCAVFQQAFDQQTFDPLTVEQAPSLLRPRTGRLGVQHPEKVFWVDHRGAGDICERRGLDRARRCLVVVRPDPYIAHVVPRAGLEASSSFFVGALG